MKKVHEMSWISLVFLLCTCGISLGQTWFEEKYLHRPMELDAATYKDLANAGTRVSFESLLDPMLIPRVPGTENHVAVKKFIKEHMKNLDWDVESDSFEDETPVGKKPFENIITTLNPETPRRLVLACHFDSKYTREYDFVGATDSAVPCAMLLHLASTMQPLLNEHKNSAHNVTLQFIFFDGEEAFQYWSSTDSIYGARHLAQKWEQTPYPPGNQEGTTMLNRMDMLVLLDLLGTKDIKLNSYFQETAHWFNTLIQTENQLRRSNYWTGSTRGSIFRPQQQYGGIEDDHIPFLQRNVDILHLIPSPFPSVWHTAKDNKDALDFPTIENLNRVFRLFVARYLWGTQDPSGTSFRPPISQSSTSSVATSVRPGPLQSIFKLFGQILQGR